MGLLHLYCSVGQLDIAERNKSEEADGSGNSGTIENPDVKVCITL